MNTTTAAASAAGNTTTAWIVVGILAFIIAAMVILLKSKASRIIKYDVNTLTTVFFVLGILFLVNAIPVTMHELALGSVRIPLEGRKDFTLNQRNTISDDSINILRGLKQDLDVTAFYFHGKPEEKAAQDLFDQYRFYSPHFKYHFVDPLTDPTAALKYRDMLRLIDPTHATILPGTVVIEMPDPGSTPPTRRVSVQLPTSGKAGEPEAKLSAALLQLTVKDKKTLFFVTGHGEQTPDERAAPGRSSLAQAKDALEKSVYLLKSGSLYKEGKVPAGTDVVLIVGPEKDFEKSEIDALRAFLDGGGRVLAMVDPTKAYPLLGAFLADHGAVLGNNIVIDPKRGFNHNPAYPLIGQFSTTSPITDGYDIEVFFQTSRSVSPPDKPSPDVKAESLAKTLDDSWALNGVDKGLPGGNISFDASRDTKGPISVAVVSTIKVKASASPTPPPSPAASPTPAPEGRLVVYGNSGFISGNFFLLFGNGDLFLRSVNWLAQRDDLQIKVRPPVNGTPLALTETQKWRLWWISFMLVPGTIAMIGIVVFMLYKPN